MQTSESIANWLSLGPIFNPAHQTDRHASGDGHPTAAEIIQAIDGETLDPGRLTASLAAGPSAGDIVSYGDGSRFPIREYRWQRLGFGDLDWADPRAVQDVIHARLGAGELSQDPADPASFAGKHHALVFFLTYVVSPDARATRLCVRSDDAIRVWLNGTEVRQLSYAGDRDINGSTQESCPQVSLRQGVNILLAAVAETHYEWGFSARFDPSQDLLYLTGKPDLMTVRGQVADALGQPLAGTLVRAFDKDLRSEQPLGEQITDADGRYRIYYTREQFRRAEKRSADLIVRAYDAEARTVATSPIQYNAASDAVVDLAIVPDPLSAPSVFEQIGQRIAPLLEDVPIAALDEGVGTQDISFLNGETGLGKDQLARFVLTHRLAGAELPPEFWFALLDTSILSHAEERSLADQLLDVRRGLFALDERAVRKSLNLAFVVKDIAESLRELVDAWVASFLDLQALHTLGQDAGAEPGFLTLALEHAGVKDHARQAHFARFFNRYRFLTPELLAELEKDDAFTADEIADLDASYRLAELSNGGFSVVKALKQRFDIRRPDQIRLLAKQSESDWLALVEQGLHLGTIDLPIGEGDEVATLPIPAAQVYAKTLDRQFRAAYPTAAFIGGLERAQSNGGAKGLRYGSAIAGLFDSRPDMELGCVSIDGLLDEMGESEVPELVLEPGFRQELKAVQRVFKLAPTFEATDALLSDGLHSAQQVYRLGESQFVKRYAQAGNLTKQAAQQAWNRAATTHAAALTVIGDLSAPDPATLPAALQTGDMDLEQFPNWRNLFQSGDNCDCEHCRSVLSPAAYFTDLLVFLRDRDAEGGKSAKDVLFERRPDLGDLELGCENANTTLP